MTHVKALQAGHSSQGTSEPITPVLTAAEGSRGGRGGGVVPLPQGGSGGTQPEFLCYLDALWCNLRHFEPKYKSSK